jgi:hypothetical protein
MGDKSPKSKDKLKKHTHTQKEKRHQAHEALMAAKQKAK